LPALARLGGATTAPGCGDPGGRGEVAGDLGRARAGWHPPVALLGARARGWGLGQG
jgi:hypothetical protein